MKSFFTRVLFAIFMLAYACEGQADDWDAGEREFIDKKPYIRPATCPAEVWAAAAPYFLPESHPLRKKLDQIFSQSRALDSTRAMKKAGFVHIETRNDKSNIYVATHPRMPGYIIKFYLDKQNIDDGLKMIKRVEGARLVQETLDRYGFNYMIKVPKKWIYPLPLEPQAKPEEPFLPKHFVLITQDMGLLAPEANKYAWKNKMSTELLTALYIVITENRMIDSIRIHNIPFCWDGKIAFIDTEFYNITAENGGIRFWKLYDYLSSEMASFLENLALNGAPM